MPASTRLSSPRFWDECQLRWLFMTAGGADVALLSCTSQSFSACSGLTFNCCSHPCHKNSFEADFSLIQSFDSLKGHALLTLRNNILAIPRHAFWSSLPRQASFSMSIPPVFFFETVWTPHAVLDTRQCVIPVCLPLPVVFLSICPPCKVLLTPIGTSLTSNRPGCAPGLDQHIPSPPLQGIVCLILTGNTRSF